MRVDNIRVYGLEESIAASGLPMQTSYDPDKFLNDATDILFNPNATESKSLKRAAKLADTPIGSGHNNYLSGITVHMNITATVKWWEQWQRYHFQQIVSSMSTMHRLRAMMEEGTIKFHEKTHPAVIVVFMGMLSNKDVTDEELAYSCPMGIELTARVNTNYLQLKTVCSQRINHKLGEWRDFISVVRELPHSELILK